jgi:hypothetical protein
LVPRADRRRRQHASTPARQHANTTSAADTVYLPALRGVQEDLQTTAALTAASVAIYM